MRSTTVSQQGQKLIAQLRQLGISDEKVLQCLGNIPRHLFVEPILQHRAYDNSALPIGFGQTISQPYIVAKMTELVLAQPKITKILEIGTGSGYQTAVLASLIEQVFSVERIKSLQYQALRQLQKLDLHNIRMKHGDGWLGWENNAPYDAILVTAAAQNIPNALVEQLAPEGMLILPLGKEEQMLTVIRKQQGQIVQQQIDNVRFVPLISGDVE